MRGYNEIRLNEATMKDALQHYFKTVLFQDGKCPNVSSVEQTASKYDDKWFTVRVDTEEPKA